MRDLEVDLTVVETEKQTGDSINSEKWREFETLADSMKKLSRSMATTPASPRLTRRN